MKVIGENKMSNDEWRNAALKIGEKLSSTGPKDYYNFTAEQWVKWAEDFLEGKETEPAKLKTIDKIKVKYVEGDKLKSPPLEENPKHLKLAIEKLIALHKLIAKDKGESAEAEEIRCDLDDYHKQLSWEDRDWLRGVSESLYELVEVKK